MAKQKSEKCTLKYKLIKTILIKTTYLCMEKIFKKFTEHALIFISYYTVIYTEWIIGLQWRIEAF